MRRMICAETAKKCDQTKISLVDQRRGLQGLPGTLLAHVPVGDLVQFGVDQRRQLVEGRLARLDERDAPPEEIRRRIGQYIRRWKQWAISGVREVRAAFEWPDVLPGEMGILRCRLNRELRHEAG
jgi:hypothetical protein